MEKAGHGGIGVLGLLQVAFIVLKVCNIITWSWWMVMCPTWVEIGLIILLLLIIRMIAIFDD